MTSINESANLDHAYFQALEETVIRLRGSPLLLSPADWQVAKRWRRNGIPLPLITRILEEIFARHTSEGGQSKARSLRYFAKAVEEEWNLSKRLGATGVRRPPSELDVAARLGALANSLPDWAPNLDTCRETILGLSGSASSVESELAELDNRLMICVLEALSSEELGAFERQAEESLADLKSRLPDEEVRHALDRLLRQIVRRSKQLPVLSLFAPEASADPLE